MPFPLFLAGQVLLSGCSRQVEGYYTGYVSAAFGLVTVRLVLAIDEETAVLTRPDGARLRLQVRRDGDRVLLHAGRAGEAVTLYRAHGGATLRCPQCRALHLPDIWERQAP